MSHINQIDNELNTLREKLASLEEQKKNEQIEQEAKKVFYEINPILISLTKYSNKELLKLKTKKDEENRIIKITEFIKHIHKMVIQYAEKNSDTKYKYHIPRVNNQINYINSYDYTMNHDQPIDEFYIKNKIEIICNLQHLFPGCNIKYVTLEQILCPRDRQLYDMDNYPHRKNFSPAQLTQYTKNIDYIMIDWS
jgi:hypothetical protein